MPIPVHYTNQAVDPDNLHATTDIGSSRFDCTTKVHEYRLDWTADFTAFYIDGVLQKKFTTNIPNVSGPWVWNNWANGNKGTYLACYLSCFRLYLTLPLPPGWSVGPPKRDSVLKIQNITMYYNTSRDGGTGGATGNTQRGNFELNQP